VNNEPSLPFKHLGIPLDYHKEDPAGILIVHYNENAAKACFLADSIQVTETEVIFKGCRIISKAHTGFPEDEYETQQHISESIAIPGEIRIPQSFEPVIIELPPIPKIIGPIALPTEQIDTLLEHYHTASSKERQQIEQRIRELTRHLR